MGTRRTLLIRATKRRLGQLWASTSFVVIMCGAIALVLGAMSVGAMYIASQPEPAIDTQKVTAAVPDQKNTPEQGSVASSDAPPPHPAPEQTPPADAPLPAIAGASTTVAPPVAPAPNHSLTLTLTPQRIHLQAESPALANGQITLDGQNPIPSMIDWVNSVTPIIPEDAKNTTIKLRLPL